MPSDVHSQAEAPPALVISELPRWIDLLSGDDPLPDIDQIEQVDASGVQFVAATLRWFPGRLRFDAAGPSPVAQLWRRLGLEAPADADLVRREDRVVGLKPRAEPMA